MHFKHALFLLLLVSLSSCGRKQNALFVNKTDEVIEVTLTFNYPYTNDAPDNYFRKSIISNEKSSATHEYKNAADFVVSLDTIANIVTLRLNPGDEFSLGTVRMGGPDRDNYKSWEFTKIVCKGDKGYAMQAENATIMKYVHKPFSIGQYTHEFVIE